MNFEVCVFFFFSLSPPSSSDYWQRYRRVQWKKEAQWENLPRVWFVNVASFKYVNGCVKTKRSVSLNHIAAHFQIALKSKFAPITRTSCVWTQESERLNLSIFSHNFPERKWYLKLFHWCEGNSRPWRSSQSNSWEDHRLPAADRSWKQGSKCHLPTKLVPQNLFTQNLSPRNQKQQVQCVLWLANVYRQNKTTVFTLCTHVFGLLSWQKWTFQGPWGSSGKARYGIGEGWKRYSGRWLHTMMWGLV